MSKSSAKNHENCPALCTISTNTLRAIAPLEPFAISALQLSLRLWIAIIFWQSGITKIANWETTLFLFEHEYQVPLLPISVAAYSSTFFEIAASFALIVGLFTRLATLPLLFMTLIIQFTYQEHHQHLQWILALLAIFFAGPGAFSLDYWIRKKHDENYTSPYCPATNKTSLVLIAVLGLFMLHELLALVTDIEPWLDGTLEWWRSVWAQE